ncbi:MAG: UDP-2,3-diacylglucosamine diphosphatase [Gemmatimonadetes bacterium]|nr:UDP-2,3-diacylglucosamine diphosphatase [Gemmatimonadota bacterium]
MSDRPAFLVSDIHLGAVPDETERSFRRWLAMVGESGSQLIINGDLFDFWFEYRRVIPGDHVRTLAALADLVDSGIPVTLMGGNHDWWGGEFFERRLGVSFHPDPLRIPVLGQEVFVAHGDGLGAGDLGYRVLRGVLRSRVTRWGFRWIHPDVGARLADWVSETEARANDPEARDYDRAQYLEQWARDLLRNDPTLHHVALGHTHLPKLVEVDPGRFYINSGDWVSHRTYVRFAPGEAPELLDWES